MDRDWWVPAVQWTLWGIAMAFAMGWIARSRSKRRPESQPARMHHPVSTLIIGLACFAFFGGIAIISNVYSNKTTTWWTTAIFIGFAFVSVPIMADYFLARHNLSAEGLSYGRLTGRRRFLKWTDVRCVQYAPVMKWFRLETSSGDVARISVMLVGLPEFARLVLRHAPQAAIDPETLPILEATANGNPPPVW